MIEDIFNGIVYYEDTDAIGVVYHANYLKYGDRARTEYLRKIGINQSILKETDKLIFIVSNVNVQYKAAAKLDNKFKIITHIENIKPASFVMLQRIYIEEKESCLMEIKIVTVDNEFKIKKIPIEIVKKLQGL